ncbi:MAG: Multidrug export protein EmrA [Variovorax sp.]|nr:MAG: Multidrug export protein EmrA [Variovorax sp.]
MIAAREQLASNQSLTEGTSVAEHPSVLAAAAKVREAYLATQRVAMPAPVDGYVAKRTVQLGQRVAAGTPMMSIVPLNQLWVDANFKEVQLRNIRIDQPVKLTADVYGKKVEYTGKVAGLGVGTGSAFALLPAQNATGNWIKVVQRVPVRIALDAEQLKANPLRIGLSMDVEVDITQKAGKMLADAPRAAALTQTQVYSQLDRGADAEVDRIVAANLGNSATAKAVHVPSVPANRAAPAISPASAAQIPAQGQPG